MMRLVLVYHIVNRVKVFLILLIVPKTTSIMRFILKKWVSSYLITEPVFLWYQIGLDENDGITKQYEDYNQLNNLLKKIADFKIKREDYPYLGDWLKEQLLFKNSDIEIKYWSNDLDEIVNTPEVALPFQYLFIADQDLYKGAKSSDNNYEVIRHKLVYRLASGYDQSIISVKI